MFTIVPGGSHCFPVGTGICRIGILIMCDVMEIKSSWDCQSRTFLLYSASSQS